MYSLIVDFIIYVLVEHLMVIYIAWCYVYFSMFSDLYGYKGS